MQETNAIFTKVTEQQKRHLFETLTKSRGLLHCKSSEELMFSLKTYRFDKQKTLICETIADFKIPLPQERVIFSFIVENEKYFFQSQLYAADNENFWEINAEMDIYKLQRRDSYRIKIPPSIKTVVLVKSGEDENAFATGNLTDLSSGGCKVSLPGIFPVIAGQNVSLEITVPRRPTFSVMGEIRHIRKIAHPNPQQSLGIKFRDVSSTLESKLFSITLELHRELNQKVSNS